MVEAPEEPACSVNYYPNQQHHHPNSDWPTNPLAWHSSTADFISHHHHHHHHHHTRPSSSHHKRSLATFLGLCVLSVLSILVEPSQGSSVLPLHSTAPSLLSVGTAPDFPLGGGPSPLRHYKQSEHLPLLHEESITTAHDGRLEYGSDDSNVRPPVLATVEDGWNRDRGREVDTSNTNDIIQDLRLQLMKRQQQDAATPSNSALPTCVPSVKARNNVLFAVEATMIPFLVILSGILAGLTLGYMSLDSTQLSVLAKTGTPKQQRYAKRVIPIRKDGHLLLITLLLANMIVNETLPVIADGVLGGGVQAVVVSTVLIVIFSEIIPQSVCSRFGLAIGSAMVGPVQILIWCFYIVSFPVARLLNYLLGPHSGVVYRRAELKELISMHSDAGGHGGDLEQDTITIVGATLDLQSKVVSDAMTPMPLVFQLPITSKLDYETLGRVLKAGHSRIPVYEEIPNEKGGKPRRKVIGVLLTKQLILLDPEDAVPLRDIPMNLLPTVPEDLPLLNILNTFQEGRSHMAIVCRRRPGFGGPSNGIRSRTRNIVGDQSIAEESQRDVDLEKGEKERDRKEDPYSSSKNLRQRSRSSSDGSTSGGEGGLLRNLFHRRKTSSKSVKSDRSSNGNEPISNPSTMTAATNDDECTGTEKTLTQVVDDQTPYPSDARMSRNSLNAVWLDEESPIGIISLEDVLEELIGEEIYDETDIVGIGAKPALKAYIPPEAVGRMGTGGPASSGPNTGGNSGSGTPPPNSAVGGAFGGGLNSASKPITVAGGIVSAVGRLGIGKGMARSRSAPGKTRSQTLPAGSLAGHGTAPTINENVGGLPLAAEPSKVGRTNIPGAAEDTENSKMSGTVESSGGFTSEPASYGTASDPNPLVSEQSDLEGLHEKKVYPATSPLVNWTTPHDLRAKGTPTSPGVTGGGGISPAGILRVPSGVSPIAAQSVPPALTAIRPPPLLSDAVLLERGRRLLVAQGADPATLPPLRLAAPRSTTASRSASKTRAGSGLHLNDTSSSSPINSSMMNVGQSGLVTGKKGAFKSPALTAPSSVPLRQPSTNLLSPTGTASSVVASVTPSTLSLDEGSKDLIGANKSENPSISSSQENKKPSSAEDG